MKGDFNTSVLSSHELQGIFDGIKECVLPTIHVLAAREFLNDNGFQIVDIIGGNQSSIVFRAITIYEGRLDQEVAIKMSICRDMLSIEEAKREQQSLKSLDLNEKHLLQVHSILYNDKYETLFVSMQLCLWGDLYHFMRGTNVARECLLSLGKQVLEAVDSLHMKGFIHGDLNPSNFLIFGDTLSSEEAILSIKLSYQTASKFLFNKKKHPFSDPSTVYYHRDFNGDECTLSGDIFSTGTVLLELAGFQVDKNWDTILQIRQGDISSLLAYSHEIRSDLLDLFIVATQLFLPQPPTLQHISLQIQQLIDGHIISDDGFYDNTEEDESYRIFSTPDENQNAQSLIHQESTSKLDYVRKFEDSIKESKKILDHSKKSQVSEQQASQEQHPLHINQECSHSTFYYESTMKKKLQEQTEIPSTQMQQYSSNREPSTSLESQMSFFYFIFLQISYIIAFLLSRVFKWSGLRCLLGILTHIIQFTLSPIWTLLNIIGDNKAIQTSKKSISEDKSTQTLEVDNQIVQNLENTILNKRNNNNKNNTQTSMPPHNTIQEIQTENSQVEKIISQIPYEQEVTTQYLNTEDEEEKDIKSFQKLDLIQSSEEDNDSDIQIYSKQRKKCMISPLVLQNKNKLVKPLSLSREAGNYSFSPLSQKRTYSPVLVNKINLAHLFSNKSGDFDKRESFYACQPIVHENNLEDLNNQKPLMENTAHNEGSVDIIVFPNGYYIGMVKNGKPHGQGKMYFHKGNRYEGQFVDGLYEGNGIYYYSVGNKYTGEWKKNLREGRGMFKWHNGTIYLGEYRNNIKEGQGVLRFNNGERFEGTFQRNNFHGKGKYFFADNARYEGQFENGVRKPPGQFYLPNGQISNDPDYRKIILPKKNILSS